MAESLHILLGTSACLQWLCHSGERTVALGPLVSYFCSKHRLFLSRNKKKYVYPCKPQFYYIKVRFKGVNII